MSKRYVLVSETVFNSMLRQDTDTTDMSTAPPPVELEFAKYEGSGAKAGYAELVEMLPKNIKSRATLLLSSIRSDLKTDANNRVIFANGTVGAHLIDYLRYFCVALQFTRAAPPQAKRFGDLLARNCTPLSALGTGHVLKRRACPPPERLKQKRPEQTPWISVYRREAAA